MTYRLSTAGTADVLRVAEPPDIRPMMAAFPTGVGVITALAEDGHPWGMTCTSMCSVTLDPPSLLVSLRSASPTLRAITTTGSFALNLLHDAARPVAELFASGAPDRFEQISWHMDPDSGGPHLPEAAHTIADGIVISTTSVGDHTLVIGEVEAVTYVAEPRPLIYGLRRFGAWRS
jgi:flavin reductase (DIM6/NTAB) family NADH-FMN oxidoreductase RutF